MSDSTRRIDTAKLSWHPRYTVWELTLRCDQFCTHCGSRAGDPRDTELSTQEALDVVQQLADLGTRDVVLIGGEAYLHPGFLEIVRALKASGIQPLLTTGGMGITPQLVRDMRSAGIVQVSVSIDGLEIAHDLIRGQKGSFQAALRALRILREEGLPSAANTNINRVNRYDLEPLFELLSEQGIDAWQVQITIPLGRAADRPDMILQPYDLLHVLPAVAAIKKRAQERNILVMPGNNLGYFGPEEALLRSMKKGGCDHWSSCQAGKFILGIESDGAVKGCPSLQTDAYVGGNLTERTLRDIWENTPELAFTRNRTTDSLWGFCKTCMFAEVCMAGCSFSAHALFGRPGNNPYCHFRARSLAKEGKRERLIPATPASGLPFDNGLFDIHIEPLDAPEPHAHHLTVSKSHAVQKMTPQEQKKHLARLVKKFMYTQEQGSACMRS